MSFVGFITTLIMLVVFIFIFEVAMTPNFKMAAIRHLEFVRKMTNVDESNPIRSSITLL